MCTTCGCSDGSQTTITTPSAGEAQGSDARATRRPHARHSHEAHAVHEHGHDHGHEAHHAHHRHSESGDTHAHPHRVTVALEQDILARNDRLAERNRGWLEARNILALNLVSSPGAGKTTLLERTIRDLIGAIPISVIEGDQATSLDAERIAATGCRSVQVNTGTGCHLEAQMLARALRALDPPAGSLLMIENVGNLVCPALFDLGERSKVVILSVTEGADKPLKYPHMFGASGLMVLNKIDLLPHVDFDVAACIGYARRINPDIEVLQLSATGGQGLQDWYAWLRAASAPLSVAGAVGA